MFFITRVGVILLPASVINSKPRSIRRNTSVSTFPSHSFFLPLFRLPSSLFFPHRAKCLHLCGNLPRRNRQAGVIALVITAKIKAGCRAPVNSNELRETRNGRFDNIWTGELETFRLLLSPTNNAQVH